MEQIPLFERLGGREGIRRLSERLMTSTWPTRSSPPATPTRRRTASR